MINFWDILKKIVAFLTFIGVDNGKIYTYLYPKIRDYVIESIDLKNDEIEEKIENLINGVVDLILKTLLGLEPDEYLPPPTER